MMMRENKFKIKHVATFAMAVGISFGYAGNVVSQIHQSSKGAASYDRMRAAGMGIMVYSNDWDDYVPFTNRGGVGLPGWGFGRPDYIWYELVEPYVGGYLPTESPYDPFKLDQRHLDPNTEQPLAPNDPNYWYAAVSRSNVALNHEFFSPWIVDRAKNYVGSAPARVTNPAQPAKTMLLVSSVWDRDQNGVPRGGGVWNVEAPCVRDSAGAYLEPVATHRANNQWYSYGGWQPDTKNWLEFGGAWPWYEHKKFQYLMLDGSIRATELGALTAGCDVKRAFQGFAFDGDAYIWDWR